jgi:DNA invertase Pin-like site-specific DNA recombinase
MLHLFAALAEKEHAMISARAKGVFAEKERGVVLGNPNLARARIQGRARQGIGS